jgi:hypothetical protein
MFQMNGQEKMKITHGVLLFMNTKRNMLIFFNAFSFKQGFK